MKYFFDFVSQTRREGFSVTIEYSPSRPKFRSCLTDVSSTSTRYNITERISLKYFRETTVCTTDLIECSRGTGTILPKEQEDFVNRFEVRGGQGTNSENVGC